MLNVETTDLDFIIANFSSVTNTAKGVLDKQPHKKKPWVTNEALDL